MNIDKNQKLVFRYVILIPHRDSLKPLEEYRQKLFAAGFSGAYSFPAAAPLASVSRPFSRQELKELAGNIREGIREEGEGRKGGMIVSTGSALVSCPDGFTFFGPVLNLPAIDEIYPLSARDKVLCSLFPTVLNVTLLEKASHVEPLVRGTEDTEGYGRFANHGSAPLPLRLCVRNIEVPPIAFRAAALANLAIRPLAAGVEGFSLEWRISPRFWLPARKGRR